MLPNDAIDSAMSYADVIDKVFGKETVMVPRVSLTVLRGIVTSLTLVTRDSLTTVQEAYPDFTENEHEMPAALFLCMELIMRQRAIAMDTTTATVEMAALAKERGWKKVEDVTDSLLQMESRLLTHGQAQLRHHPELQKRFLDDDDTRSYDDTMTDLRRRLDLMMQTKYAAIFTTSPRSETLREEAERMMREASLFRQAREGRLESRTRLTYLRNILFTVLIEATHDLQDILRASLEDTRPELLSRIDAQYWWNLTRLGRNKARRPESNDEDATEATDSFPSEPVAPADATSTDGESS